MDRRDIFERDIVFSLQKSPTQGSGTPSNPWTASTSPGDRASIAINRTGRLVVQGSLVVGFMRSQESGGGDSITGIAEVNYPRLRSPEGSLKPWASCIH